MSESNWVFIGSIYGRLLAEIFKSQLESLEIPCQIFQESAGHTAYPVNVEVLGRVDFYVPEENAEEAKELMQAFTAEQTDNSETSLEDE